MFELSRLTAGNPCHPPLIFLHGFLGGKEDWQEIFPFFQKKFYCIAFDLPGHGESPYVEELLTVIKDALPLKPICIGYSLGGRIALQLHKHLKAIIAISAHPGLITQEEKTQRQLIDQAWCDKLLNLPLADFLAEWYAQPIFQTLTNNSPLFQTILQRRLKQNPQHLVLVLRQMSLATQPLITDFSCPTLLLSGEEDWKYRTLYSRLPKTVTTRSVKSCSHAAHLENAQACAEHITQWMENYDANT